MEILKKEVGAVLDLRTAHETARAYYDGAVPEAFASDTMRRLFGRRDTNSKLNFCRPIVSAVTNRLELASIASKDEEANAIIKDVWEKNDLGLEANEIHRLCGIYGECYAMVWPDEEGNIQISYVTPEHMTMVYREDNPRLKQYAVKIWSEGDNKSRLNKYTDSAIYKYSCNSDTITEGSQWTLIEVVENPFGKIPVFHFRNSRPQGRPEHYDAYDSQDAINKLFITNMVTIDYQGAPQRYALAKGDSEVVDFEEGDTERENVASLKNGPGELWFLKGVDEIGEFKPADPDNFWAPIKEIVRAMAALTDTPLHYFEKTGNNPTGNGLRTAEAPLLKKVKDRQDSFGYTWRDLFRFVLLVSEKPEAEVQVFWQTNESLDEMERWDVSLKKINSGLSHRQALREGGYSEPQIEKIMQERKAEREEGLMYQRNDGSLDRSPQTRVSTSQNDTLPKDTTQA